MSKEKLFSFLWSVCLSFCLSFGATACMVTAFSMEVSLPVLAIYSMLGSLIFSICYALPLGAIPPAALALAGGYLWQAGPLKLSFEAICYRISRTYHQAYNWPIIKLNVYTADDMEAMLVPVVCALAMLIAWVIAWSICRKRPLFPGLILSALPLASCLVVTDTIPNILWLFLYLASFVLSLLCHTTRKGDQSQGNRLCTYAAVPVILGMLVLFAAMPQDNYQGAAAAKKVSEYLKLSPIQLLTQLFQDTPVSGTISTNQVNLTDVGMRMESKAQMMTVTADNYTGILYLRGRCYDTYDGWHWTFAGKQTFSWPSEILLEPIGEVEIVTKYAHRMRYTPYYPQSISLSESPEGFVNTKQLTRYSYPCAIAPTNKEEFENKLNGITRGDDSFLGSTIIVAEGNLIPLQGNIEVLTDAYEITLPDRTLAWAQKLLEKIPGAQDGSVSKKAQAIAAYVRQSATYSTDVSKMPKDKIDFAKWFIEEQDSGYCVHFASATTVLLQAAGIPARYVTGYVANVTAGEASTVLLKDSHAWTEYYLPGFGWTVLESTPVALREPTQQETLPNVTPPQASQQATGPDDTKPQQTAPTTPDSAPQKVQISAQYLWLLLIPGVIGLIWLQRSVRLHRRRSRCRKGSANQQALALWQEAVYFAKLLKQAPDEKLHQLAQKAKFSAHTLTEEELAVFTVFLEEAISILKKRSVFHQLYYRLILCAY